MAPEILTLESGRPPRFADRYRVVTTLDTAGIAHVYLAWDDRMERWVSLKILSTKWVRDARVRSRFKNESETLRHVEHHNVLEVYASSHDDPFAPYVVTEVAEGGTVDAWLEERGPMEPYLAIHVMAMLCSGLDAAHLAGVEHAELGVEHLLINRHGVIKLKGFRGSASFGGSVSAYNDTADATEIFYTLLSGRRFEAGQAAETLTRLGPVLAPIIRKGARRKRQGDRYGGVMALSRDLEASILSLPIPESPLPVLSSPECALPDDWRQCFDPSESFPDLEMVAKMMRDPDVAADTDDINLYDQITKLQSHREEPEPSREGFSEAPVYQAPKGPLYQEIEDRESEAWGRIQSSTSEGTDVVVKPTDRAPSSAREGPPTWVVKAGLGLACAVVFAALAVMGFGAYGVRNARLDHDVAASDLVKVITDEGGVVYSLSAAGGDRAELEKRYFAFSDAPEQRKLVPALSFANLVISEATRNGLDPLAQGGPVDGTTESIARVDKTLRYYKAQRETWDQSAKRFPGIVVVTVGLAGSPD
jgi:hypothetical protein